MPPPMLTVNGVGKVSENLKDAEVDALAKVASQAPYGQGSLTLVNKDVRNALQIEPKDFSFDNSDWDLAVKLMTDHIAGQFNIDPEYVEAKIYKLVLYQEGGHFKPHKDTEKHVGMFGTLVIQLPGSDYSGGKAIVRHRGIEKVYDLSNNMGFGLPVHTFCEEDLKKPSRCAFYAHYADCEHELQEITSGKRLIAIYSLCWKGDGPPRLQTLQQVSDALVEHLSAFDGCRGFMLDHQYSMSTLARYGVKALKGTDREKCDALLAASGAMESQASRDKLIIHIVKATRHDHDDGEKHHRSDPAIKNFQEDVFCQDGSEPSEASINVLKSFRMYDDVVNPDLTVFEDKEGEFDEAEPNDKWWADSFGKDPSELQRVEFMGNEAADIENLYSSFAVTFWRENWASMQQSRQDNRK